MASLSLRPGVSWSRPSGNRTLDFPGVQRPDPIVSGPPGGPPSGLSIPHDPRGEPNRRLRPAPFSGLFEIGARLLRRHAGTLLVLAVVFTLPGALLSAAAGVRLTDALAGILPDLSDGVSRQIVIGDEDVRRIGDAMLLVLGASVAGRVPGCDRDGLHRVGGGP